MQRIASVDPGQASGKVKQLLDAVHVKLGMVPNLMKTLAASPASLEAYLSFGGALAAGRLDARFREQIALAVAQANGCEYCLSAHSALGKMAGLKQDEILDSRDGHSQEKKRNVGLQFAQQLVLRRGQASDENIEQLRAAGYSDGEITEVIANVAVNIFTNYFNLVAHTEIDFPNVELALPTTAL